MAVEVEFITLGKASEQLGVPAPTLRLWTDQLEQFEVHYVMRNDSNERLYYDTDLELFAYLRDLKKEHGRKTTTKDLAYMIYQQCADGEGAYTLRTREEVPYVEPTNTHLDLLNQKDIQKLLESDRVRQFVGVIVDGLRDELIKEVREIVREELLDNRAQLISILEESERREMEKLDSIEQMIGNSDTDDKIMAEIEKLKEIQLQQPKSFMQRLFGK